MQYYEFVPDLRFDAVLRQWTAEISDACRKSEPQFLSRTERVWNIPKTETFSFLPMYYVEDAVMLFCRGIWERFSTLGNLDRVFAFPVRISYCGECFRYYGIVPPAIDCLNEHGQILSGEVGRYPIFRTMPPKNGKIIFTEMLAIMLQNEFAVHMKGV